MKENSGKLNLAKKIFTVISSVFTFSENNVYATSPSISDGLGNEFNFETPKRNISKPKLILKLSTSNISKGKVMMHTSHASHASHASHYSSSSSSSSYERTVVPRYEPVLPSSRGSFIDVNTPNNKTSIQTPSKTNKSTPYYILGSRTLFKGCHGTDVKELQELLIGLGYDLLATGIFDELTKVAVEDFQKSNDLTPDGRVGAKTLFAIRSK